MTWRDLTQGVPTVCPFAFVMSYLPLRQMQMSKKLWVFCWVWQAPKSVSSKALVVVGFVKKHLGWGYSFWILGSTRGWCTKLAQSASWWCVKKPSLGHCFDDHGSLDDHGRFDPLGKKMAAAGASAVHWEWDLVSETKWILDRWSLR